MENATGELTVSPINTPTRLAGINPIIIFRPEGYPEYPMTMVTSPQSLNNNPKLLRNYRLCR